MSQTDKRIPRHADDGRTDFRGVPETLPPMTFRQKAGAVALVIVLAALWALLAG